MGAHRTIKPAKKSVDRNVSSPTFPSNKGKHRTITSIYGRKVRFLIEDEISKLQSSASHKLIVFQKIRFEDDGRIEFRLGYYMLGVKKSRRNKWVWGQFCLMIPKIDLKAFLDEARERNWFK